MEIVNSDAELEDYMNQAVKASPDHPVLVDRYLTGKEIEVDAICDGDCNHSGYHGTHRKSRCSLR